jgi:hypothetical protein
MGHPLVRGGDVQRGRVVVSAEVRGDASSPRRSDEAKEGRAPGLVEHGLRRLDHDLERERPLGEAEMALEQLEQLGERGRLVRDRHLRERHDEVPGKPSAGLPHERRQKEVESANRATLQLFGEGLDPEADARGERCLGETFRHLDRRRFGMAVLLRIRAVPVPILEVDAEVLDRLPLELRHDAFGDPSGEIFGKSESAGQVPGLRRVRCERPPRERSQPGGAVGLKELRPAVDGVDRLPSR